jgi:hypothetical protein
MIQSSAFRSDATPGRFVQSACKPEGLEDDRRVLPLGFVLREAEVIFEHVPHDPAVGNDLDQPDPAARHVRV